MLIALVLQAALCVVIGGLGGYLYTAWLCQDIDAITANTEVPMMKANAIRDVWPRRFAKVIAGYQQQVKPRLLVRFHPGLFWCTRHEDIIFICMKHACPNEEV